MRGRWATEGKRRFHLFVFSRLRGRFARQGGHRAFEGPVALALASPVDAFLESLALNLMRERYLRLGQALFGLIPVEVALPPIHQRLLRLKLIAYL